jgi:hypothetical protein
MKNGFDSGLINILITLKLIALTQPDQAEKIAVIDASFISTSGH